MRIPPRQPHESYQKFDRRLLICISLLPDGSLDDGSRKVLEQVGVWMRRNGEGIYGSHAWKVPGEGKIMDGELKQLPGGAPRKQHADFTFPVTAVLSRIPAPDRATRAPPGHARDTVSASACP